MNAQSPHQWWSILKSAVFGSSLSLTRLVGGGGGPVWNSVGKDDLLPDYFDSKQCRESIDLPFTYHLSRSLITFDFRLLLLDLDPYGGNDPLMFYLFWREQLMFWPLVSVWCFGSWSVWVVSQLAGDSPKLPQFRKVYRPPLMPTISITPVLSKLIVWWRFMWNDLWNAVAGFQPPSLLIGKVLVPVMHLFCVGPIQLTEGKNCAYFLQRNLWYGQPSGNSI